MGRFTRANRAQPTPFGPRANRQSGFALVALLFLVPVLLILVSGLALTALSLRNYTIAKSSCRRAVWLAQVDMGKALQELLRLNPEARRLRMQRKLVEAQLAAAKISLQFELVAALQAHKALIIAHQSKIRAQQQRLIFQAGLRRRNSPVTFKESTLSINIKKVRMQSLTSNLAVQFVPPQDLSPDVVVPPGFERRQALTLLWQAELLSEAPMEIMSALNIKSLNFNGQCAATLEKEGSKWLPQLVAGKS